MARSLALVLLLVAACAEERGTPNGGDRLRVWHTFNPRETEALNRVLAPRHHRDRLRVETRLLPFSRAQLLVREALETGGDECPDLVRIDASWLPGLARARLVRAVHRRPHPRQWLPEATALTRYAGAEYGVPQSIDGLALLYDVDRVESSGVPWPPTTVNELIATAHRLTINGSYGLSVRIDGYWFLAFLRAWGGDVLDPQTGDLGIDTPIAATALSRFATLFATDGVAPPPPAPGDEAPTAAKRFRAGRVAIVVDGPWAVAELRGGRAQVGVAPFPRDPVGRPAAPFGGHLFVVPTCAPHADEAWALAYELTDARLQSQWARELGLVPTTETALARSPEFTRAFRDALLSTRPLPRHPVSTEMFDDLTPAVSAVVARDAGADEALAGVARAWRRLLSRRQP